MPALNLKTSTTSRLGISKAFLMKRDVNRWSNKVRLSVREMADKKNALRTAQYVRNTMRQVIWSEQAKVGSYYITFDKATGRMRRKYRPEYVNRYKNGQVVATYKIGNLKRSIHVLHHLKSTNFQFVGPRYRKRSFGGMFDSGSRVDPWYAHIVNNGSSKARGMFFLEKTIRKTRTKGKRMLMRDGRKALRRSARRLKIAS